MPVFATYAAGVDRGIIYRDFVNFLKYHMFFCMLFNFSQNLFELSSGETNSKVGFA